MCSFGVLCAERRDIKGREEKFGCLEDFSMRLNSLAYAFRLGIAKSASRSQPVEKMKTAGESGVYGARTRNLRRDRAAL